MTDVITVTTPTTVTVADARRGTDALKAAVRTGEHLWRQAYAEEWWRLLDYPSWNAYCVAELGVTTRQARYYVTQVKAEAIAGGNVSARQARAILAAETVDADVIPPPHPSPAEPPPPPSSEEAGEGAFSPLDHPSTAEEDTEVDTTGGGGVDLPSPPVPSVVFRWDDGEMVVDASDDVTRAMWVQVEVFAGREASAAVVTGRQDGRDDLPTAQQFTAVRRALEERANHSLSLTALVKATLLPYDVCERAATWLAENESDVKPTRKGWTLVRVAVEEEVLA